ncbi:TPA: hypothetical protein ACY3ID_002286 [Citrobacter amalonaticus]|uniref:hypothetical protein n=1 Tax=Citrobacter TaxID=544 RepID=UPI0012409553|nr:MULTISPECIES: hypothetical protein [Citrobacter]QIO37527.1 hypothetical protein HAP28_17945 [Citrobacter sp. Y3]
MTTITKERVAEIIHAAGLEPCDYEEVFGSIKTGEIVAMARIALASLEAEPVAYLNATDIKNSEDHILAKRLRSHACTMPVYTAPPAPVVPDEMTMADAIMEIDAKDADRWTGRIGFQKGWNACRATMLQGKAEPVSNRDELPPDEIECDICGHVSTDPEGRHHCCEDNSND